MIVLVLVWCEYFCDCEYVFVYPGTRLERWLRLFVVVGVGVCLCLLLKGAWWMPWHAGPMKDV